MSPPLSFIVLFFLFSNLAFDPAVNPCYATEPARDKEMLSSPSPQQRDLKLACFFTASVNPLFINI